jgi:hypothetical protein
VLRDSLVHKDLKVPKAQRVLKDVRVLKVSIAYQVFLAHRD